MAFKPLLLDKGDYAIKIEVNFLCVLCYKVLELLPAGLDFIDPKDDLALDLLPKLHFFFLILFPSS